MSDKKQGSVKKKKPVVPVSAMKTTTIYIGLSDKRLYRKLNDKLEVMEGGGVWKEVKLSYGFLQDMKFREY